LDLEGKIIYERNFTDILTIAKVPELDWVMAPLAGVPGIKSEISHLNSIHEIPPLSGKNHPHWIKEGNIIINGLKQGFFVLSSDLKTVLHHTTFKNSVDHRIHDVQVNRKGRIFYFNNTFADVPYKFVKHLGGMSYPPRLYFGIFEEDASSLKVIHKFTSNPVESFYSWVCGSIQELDDDTWLFSHFLMGSYIYSKSKNSILLYTPSTHATYEKFQVTQQVKLFDLTKFLSFWPK
jgi:hypothetical protein